MDYRIHDTGVTFTFTEMVKERDWASGYETSEPRQRTMTIDLDSALSMARELVKDIPKHQTLLAEQRAVAKRDRIKQLETELAKLKGA